MDFKEMYDKASEWTAGVFGGVQTDQYDAPTPCPEWNVKEMMNHIIGGGHMFAAAAQGADMSNPGDPPGDMVGDDPEGSYRRSAAAVRASMEYPGVMEQMVKLPAAELPGQAMYGIAISEALVHGWDLAKATGQDTAFPDDLAKAVYDYTAPGVDFGRQGGFYGEEVEVGDDAPWHQKLVGLLGRQP